MKHDLYMHTVTHGALRAKWEFEYGAKELADAAFKQAGDRTARRDRWKAKYAEVMAAIKESGINVRESLADLLSNNVNAYRNGAGPTIVVDDKLRADLMEAHERVGMHDKAAEEYEAWRQVMLAQGERRLSLTHADWVFFFGGLDKSE